MNRLIVALDVSDLTVADHLAGSLASEVGGFKVGLELLMGFGPSAIEKIAGHGLPIFADTKLHDIPNTVEKASRQIADAGARWLTVHASGGREMIEAAVSGMDGSGVLAVTVLTSLDDQGLASIGFKDDMKAQVRRLVAVAEDGGAEGIVCSPLEIADVSGISDRLAVFTPGVRPSGSSHDDQVRVSTPREAIAAGADYLVVGRPITNARDPVAAAAAIVTEITPDTGVADQIGG